MFGKNPGKPFHKVPRNLNPREINLIVNKQIKKTMKKAFEKSGIDYSSSPDNSGLIQNDFLEVEVQ